MNPTPSDISIANLVSTHYYLSWIYYTKVAWPYIVCSFLLGSIPFGLIVGRVFFKSDIRASGSGNIGAANAARTYGRGAGFAVLVLDALKGAGAVGLSRLAVYRLLSDHATTPFFSTPMLPHIPYQFGDTPISVMVAIGPLCGLAAVVGHCFSPWLGFRGGKGVATYLGALMALGVFALPVSPFIFALIWVLIVLRTGYASLGSIVATAAVTIFVCIKNAHVGDGDVSVLFALATLVIIVSRHRANIARLRSGTEPKLTLGSAKGPQDSNGKRVGSI